MEKALAGIRLALLGTMIAAALGSGGVSAQRSSVDEGTYESEVTGLEIAFTDDWELGDTQVYSGPPDEESVELVSGYGTLSLLFGIEDDAEASRDAVLGGFESAVEDVETLDEGYEDGIAWTLAEATASDGASGVLYIEVLDEFVDDYQLVTMIVTDEDIFLDQYELVQDTVEVDGEELFDRATAVDIETVLDGGAEETGRTRDRATEGATEESDGNITETGRTGDGTPGSAMGDTYAFQEEDLELVVSRGIAIDDVDVEEGTYEQILLVGGGSIGAVSLIDNALDADQTLEAFMSGFITELDRAEEIDSGDDGDVAWTLYEARISGTDFYVYATIDPTLFEEKHYLELIAAPADAFEDEFVAFQESVEVGGDGMFAGTDVDDLLEIVEAS